MLHSVFFQKFKIKDLGVISRFLDVDFKVELGKTTMIQERYLTKVLERYCMAECKAKSLSSEQKLIFLRMQNHLIQRNTKKTLYNT